MMFKKSSFILLLGLVLFSGCSESESTIKDNRDMDPIYNIINSSQYPQDTTGKKEFKSYYSDVDDDVRAFNEEYNRLTGKTAPRFDGNMIIAKSGERSNGGYNISIADVKDIGRYTEVTILLESPGKGCLSTMALTNPYVIAEIPDDHKEIKFIERAIEVDCK